MRPIWRDGAHCNTYTIMTNSLSRDKINPFLLSEQVKRILYNQGFTTLFNYSDYEHFKRKCKGAFNKPNEIAKLFIADALPEQNDFNQYIF